MVVSPRWARRGVWQIMIVVALKWVPLRIDVDPLSGVASSEPRDFGLSLADQAALELALQIANHRGVSVTALTVGPPAADGALREAFAAGVDRSIRIDSSGSGIHTARALAPHCVDAQLVLCGDYSLDLASGSVPAYLAALLGLPQALGLVQTESLMPLIVTRRLDRGARERLEITGPAVLSVEGSVAQLRRATTASVIASHGRQIELHSAPISGDSGHQAVAVSTPMSTGPYRPPSRRVASPVGSTRTRVLAVTGSLAGSNSSRRELRVDPAVAASEIVDQLRAWGYLPS